MRCELPLEEYFTNILRQMEINFELTVFQIDLLSAKFILKWKPFSHFLTYLKGVIYKSNNKQYTVSDLKLRQTYAFQLLLIQTFFDGSPLYFLSKAITTVPIWGKMGIAGTYFSLVYV